MTCEHDRQDDQCIDCIRSERDALRELRRDILSVIVAYSAKESELSKIILNIIAALDEGKEEK